MFDTDMTEEEINAKAELGLITASMLIDFMKDLEDTSEASTTLKNICIECGSDLLFAHVYNTAFSYMQDISKLISQEEKAIEVIGNPEKISLLTDEADQFIMRLQTAIALLHPQVRTIVNKTRELAMAYEQMKKEFM